MIKITVDLGNDRGSDCIIVYRGQEHQTMELAKNFCQKHGFDTKIQNILHQQIVKNIDMVKQHIEDQFQINDQDDNLDEQNFLQTKDLNMS